MTTRTKAILGLSGVFILGLLCGALALGLFVRDLVRERDSLKNSAGFREYFADELSLTEGQKDSLQTELERAYEEMADIRGQVEQEYREVFDTLSRRMAPVLTPSQRRVLAQQKERLLPKRAESGRQENLPPSIGEIDRKVATTPAPAARDTGSGSSKIESKVNDQELGEQKSSLVEPADDGTNDLPPAQPGDSILTPETREEHLPRILAHMKKQLDLTDDQTAKVRELVRKGVRRNLWILQNFKDEPLVRGRRLRQSFRLLDRQVADLLTEEQLKRYNGMKKLRKKKFEE